MAKKLKVGDALRGYTVTTVFGPGAMAISYAAQSPDGRKIFLKQYKSPAPTVVWYPAFVDYQQELAARVRGGRAANYAVRLVDAFEETWGGPTYFQAYEFVEHGGDLQQILDEERAQHERTGRAPVGDADIWARHVTWAKVFLAGLAALHEAKIVHADLKPPNVYLIRDPTIGAGYQLKLIDMDFSVLADRRAPWHGYQGYVGSDNYRSPEHLTRGQVPGLASDVFTCGLILSELLAGVHPYWREDQAEYAQLVRAYAATPPVLVGVIPAPATNAEVSAALSRCLAPDPAARPTAAELRAILSGRAAKPAPPAAARPTAVPSPPSRSSPPHPAPAPPPPPRRRQPHPRRRRAHRTRQAPRPPVRPRRRALGRAPVRARAAPRRPVAGNAAAGHRERNARQRRGRHRPRVLRAGDVLAVGRQAKGIAKLPLTVHAL